MLATVHTGMINYFYPGVFLGAKLFDLGDGAGFLLQDVASQRAFPTVYISVPVSVGQWGV